MSFDPVAATQAYLDTLNATELEIARAYTTGNHWLLLWSVVVSALVTLVIVRSGLLGKVAAMLSARGWALRTFLVAAVFLLASSILTLPWSFYTEWWREGQYGQTSQPLADWLGQSAIGLPVNTVLFALFLLGVYALIRKAGRLWWVWSGAFVMAAASFMLLLSPVLIEPLFNDYEPIPEGGVREGVLALAAEAGVPESRVFMYDGSRQSNNFTANVSGVGASARIAISDVALDEAPLDEVLAVTGHEIGHYVSGHIWRMLAVLSATAMLIFFLTDRTYRWFARRFGTDAELHDPRGVPVFVFVVGLLFVLAQPIFNTLIRVGEREADAYSLATVGLPDALSKSLIKTAEYRYPLAGPVEEAIFYTHPTVENRVRAAMEWKAAHPGRPPMKDTVPK